MFFSPPARLVVSAPGGFAIHHAVHHPGDLSLSRAVSRKCAGPYFLLRLAPVSQATPGRRESPCRIIAIERGRREMETGRQGGAVSVYAAKLSTPARQQALKLSVSPLNCRPNELLDEILELEYIHAVPLTASSLKATFPRLHLLHKRPSKTELHRLTQTGAGLMLSRDLEHLDALFFVTCFSYALVISIRSASSRKDSLPRQDSHSLNVAQ